jgi:dipeptidyl aminopeptidase/acylaminoacyl peptidase
MGQVYRARDPRLHREVALKVLHPSVTITTEHLERFNREARATGALNHPNIRGVFDAGVEGGIPYVISELLEGESLRERLDKGPLPYRKALEYGIQIAQALGAAHASGIYHRDVKPANVFITDDGRVKLLDFGLAKLTETDEPPGSHDDTADASRAGVIRGTAAYMSPEQARGQRVDHRTDLFSLGAVLYEMLTGARTFQRASTVETLHAVLREEPVDPLELNPALPPAAVVTVRRCLEKNVEERFQSARDLAFQLQQLQESTAKGRPATDGQGRAIRRVAVALLAAAALAGLIALIAGLIHAPAPNFERLTFRRGRVGGARFASGGQSVVYSVSGEDNEMEVWRLDLADSPRAQTLGYRRADVLATRKGELALSAEPRFVGGEHVVGRLVIASIVAGGPRHELMADAEGADWDASGEQLAAVFSTGMGGEGRLEYPIGRPLYTARSIRCPRVSRDGRHVAFLEDRSGAGIGGRVAIVDLEGHFTALTDDFRNVRGLAWSADGTEVWFTAGGWRANRALHAVSLGGRVRDVFAAPSSLTLWDIASDGRVLLSHEEETRGVMGRPPGAAGERVLSYHDSSGLASLSPDGRWILMADQFGCYLRATDDASPLTDLGLAETYGDDVNNARTVVATGAAGSHLLLLPWGTSLPRTLPAHGISAYYGALFFPDGRRLLFNGSMAKEGIRAYVQNIDGGGPQPLTPLGTKALAISPDGQWVAATRPDPGIWLYPVSGEAPPRPVAGSQEDDRPAAWSADGKALWVFRRDAVPASVFRLDLQSGQRQLWKTLIPPDPVGVYSIIQFKVTPTGDAYFYGYTRVLSQLYVARGLR